MDQAAEQKLKNHFLSWSGGTTPDNEHEIYVYSDLARLVEFDSDEVYYCLKNWMDEINRD